jgi:peptide deformylase
MAILPIIETPDPRLRVISEPVEVFDDELKTLVADMFETMYDAPGIGLAAIQVGVPKRILVIDLQEPDPEDPEGKKVIRQPRVFINPVFSEESEEDSVYQEGCLSVPEQYADVVRPAEVTVDYQDENGEKHREHMTGLMATCIQHEHDHLEGILFIDHLSKLKRDMLLKKLAKSRR